MPNPNTINYQPAVSAPEGVINDVAVEAFMSRLDSIAKRVPEIADQQGNIKQYGGELISEFGIQPELFDDSHTFFFAAIADRYGSLEQRKESLSLDEYAKEKEFILDATCLLALDKSTLYPEFKPLLSTDRELPADEARKTYDDFTDKPMTKELEKAVADGLLDDVKQRLGITSENEDSFKLRVLNASNNVMAFVGMSPESVGIAKRSHKDPVVIQWLEKYQQFKTYQQGLETRAEQFSQRMDQSYDLPLAWITWIGDEKNLIVPMPVAEKLIHGNDKSTFEAYGEDDKRGDQGIFEHEYTHTQGGLALDHNIYYGIMFEELRAEHFSGNTAGYQDIKGFALDLGVVAGVHPTRLMEGQTKGGNTNNLFEKVANQLGLQEALELALTVPKPYIHDSRPLQKSISNYLGDPDKFTERLYEKLVSDGKDTEINDRFEEMAARFTKMSEGSFEMWAGHRRAAYGLEFTTQKLEKIVARKKAEAQASEE